MTIGNYNITADDLEASGMLDALGLTVIRPANTEVTRTMGNGSLIDYAPVTTRSVAEVESVEAVTTVP